MRTALGLVAIDAIEVIAPEALTDADAAAANYPSLTALRAMFDSQEGTCYRITLHRGGPDPRNALQQNDELSAGDLEAVTAKLARLDAQAETPWTAAVLALIELHPGVVSTDLAARLGQDRAAFKERVRKLKALGLTLSLDVGYRLSPRGAAVLKRR